MRQTMFLAAACFLLGLASTAPAEDAVKHRILFAEYGKGPNRLVELDADGKLVWEYKFPSIAVIFQPLPDGHVLFAYGGNPTGVDEINRDKKTVWNYVSKCPQVLGCQRLANGNTLVAEQGPCQAVEVNPKGKVVHVTTLTTTEKEFHLQVRSIHKLANGNILAAHEGEGAIREIDPDGKVVWEYTKVENAGDAIAAEQRQHAHHLRDAEAPDRGDAGRQDRLGVRRQGRPGAEPDLGRQPAIAQERPLRGGQFPPRPGGQGRPRFRGDARQEGGVDLRRPRRWPSR